MLKNYLILFARNLMRQKLFSIVNLLGLTVGITSTLLIYLYVRNDLDHDRFHENADRIYRVNQTHIWGDGDGTQLARTGPAVAHALREELPEVELVTSIHTAGNFVIGNQSVTFDEDNVLAADSNFFRMFTFEMIQGDPNTCLIKPQSIVLTQLAAQRYFGREDALGKHLQVGVNDNKQLYEVTGVVKDIPGKSYLDFDILLSSSTFPQIKQRAWSWIWTQMETFIRLDSHANVETTATRMRSIPRKHAGPSLQAGMNMSFDDYVKKGKSWELYLQPLVRIHLHSDNVVGNNHPVGNVKIVYTLIGVAILILVLSCINFMNLSTAQFTRRIKEASIRKILGLGRSQLGIGYYLEAFGFCLLSVIGALAVIQILLPWFNAVTGKMLTINPWHDAGLMTTMVVLLIIMTIMSGSVPAIFLSSFSPLDAMKGRVKSGREGKVLRDALVVIQFTASIVLIISTTIVFQQLNFFFEKDLGFDKENLLVISNVERLQNATSFTNDISNLPEVVNASFTGSVPLHMGSDVFRPENFQEDFKLNFAVADENYITTLGTSLIVGRNFSPGNAADKEKVILNETAVKSLGWKVDDSVIGRIVDYPNESTSFEVIGVVKDHHFTSLESMIEPMAIFHINGKVFNQNRFVLIRLMKQPGEGFSATLSTLKKLWKQHAGDLPFKYEFVDQSFQSKMESQQQFGIALKLMSLLAILIACLGLLAMTIYTLEQRTKEIGIRKISGAGIHDVLVLIYQGSTKLIVIAFAIGAPVSYWLIQKWLEDFANRITPSVWVFVATGIATLLFSFLITAYHTLKAARANPIDVLKDE